MLRVLRNGREAFSIRLSPCFQRSDMEIRVHGVRVIAAQSFPVFDGLLCACSCYHAIRGFHNIELRACAKSLHRGQVPLEDSLFHTSTARGSHLSRRSSSLALPLSFIYPRLSSLWFGSSKNQGPSSRFDWFTITLAPLFLPDPCLEYEIQQHVRQQPLLRYAIYHNWPLRHCSTA